MSNKSKSPRARQLAGVFEEHTRRLRHSLCERKIRYTKEFPAQLEAFLLMSFDGNGGARVRAYRCGFCAGWHVGRVNPKGGVW